MPMTLENNIYDIIHINFSSVLKNVIKQIYTIKFCVFRSFTWKDINFDILH